MRRLFIFGLGDSARRLAHRACAAGFEVAGTIRTAGNPRLPQVAGVEIVHFDGLRRMENAARLLGDVTHLLCSIPPGQDGDAAALQHGSDMPAGLRWIGYLSTTGVYGDHGGGWVDETTPAAPGSERAARRLAAEQQWQTLGDRLGVPVAIFRLPGIYGPGRSALDQVRAGTARRIVRERHVFSRIHVDDIAGTVLAALCVTRGGIFNVADDLPAPQAEVVLYASALLRRVPPPLVEHARIKPGLSPMARSFWDESRRVRNERIKRELGVALAYPTYREGLRAILAQDVFC